MFKIKMKVFKRLGKQRKGFKIENKSTIKINFRSNYPGK